MTELENEVACSVADDVDRCIKARLTQIEGEVPSEEEISRRARTIIRPDRTDYEWDRKVIVTRYQLPGALTWVVAMVFGQEVSDVHV